MCLWSQILSGRSAHSQKSHFKAKDVSRARTLGRVSWWQTGSKAQEPFFQGAPMASVRDAQISRSYQHHREHANGVGSRKSFQLDLQR